MAPCWCKYAMAWKLEDLDNIKKEMKNSHSKVSYILPHDIRVARTETSHILLFLDLVNIIKF
jgi:hypothetical protein